MKDDTHEDDSVAVIGIGIRLPGRIHDFHALWTWLERRGESAGPIPIDRWIVEDYFDSDRVRSGRTHVRSGSFLERIDAFDASFFNISPREAKSIDPQHRLTLEVAWEALEQAGIVPATLAGTRTGVFVGIGTSDYDFLREDVGEARTYLGTQPSFAAGRLAFILGLHGPTMSVDTGCSSSLVSLHLARRALLNRECEIALSGAVQIMAAPDHYVQLAKIGALAPDGRSKTFSARADGFGRGEGVVVLVLERLADARANQRDILAIIRGTAVNHNGTDPTGITAPNESAQRALLWAALDDAGLNPAAIDFIECHGTGTAIGDPIEVRAISSVHAQRPVDQPVRIGSIKPNVGHLEVAAGMAGVSKVLASFAYGALPPTINTRPRNPAIDWASSRVEVVDELIAWPRVEGRVRRAGVSAFGLSGTNAHAILEEAPVPEPRPTASEPIPSRLPLLVSGPTTNDLGTQTARLVEFLRRLDAVDVLDLSYSLATSRTHFACRLAVMVQREWGPQQLATALEQAGGRPSAWVDSSIDPLEQACEHHVRGEAVDWPGLFQPWAARRMRLPTYAFTRERHWLRQAPSPVTLLLSSASEPGIRARAEQLHARLAGQTSLIDLGAGLAKIEHAEYRASVVARSRDGALAALAAIAAGESHPQVSSGEARLAGKLVFAFPGQGAQWPEMARELSNGSPTFADAIEACERAFAPHVDWSLAAVLREPSAAMFERVDVIQPVLFAMMVSLALLWRELGVRPDAVFGQSQGEIAAAHVAGALSLDDAAKVVCLRSRALRALEGKGAMAAVVLPRERLAPYLEPFDDRLALAGDNGPSTVVCGQPEAIEALIERLALDDVFARRINVNYASHTAQVEMIRDELLTALADIEPRRAEIPMYSTVDARWVGGEELDAYYWYRNLRQVIRLADAVEGLLDDGHRWFIEVSPHPVVSVSLEVLFDQLGATALAVPTLRRDKGGLEQLQLSLAQLWTRGHAHDFATQFEALGARPLELELEPASAPVAGTSAPVMDPFWTAVDRADVEALGDALSLEAGQRELLVELFPMLTAARTKQLQAESIPRLRYRVEWIELGRTGTKARGGPWVIVASSAIAVELPEGCDASLLVLDDDVTPEQLDAALGRVAGVAGIVSLLALDERPHPLYPALPLGLTLNLAVGQAVGRRTEAVRLWTATRGAVSIGVDDALACPNQAMCWGLGHSLSLAQPSHWGGLIDLAAEWGEPSRVGAASVSELLDLLVRDDGEDELARRGSRTFARRLVRAPLDSKGDANSPALRGAVLITGGTGAVGGHFARWLARAGANELILASRTGAAAAGVAELTGELERLGARVSIETCDVAERESVARLFERLRSKGIELRGIVHAAGIPGPTIPLAELSVAQLAEVVAGKAGGARWLHELAAEHELALDVFVVLSSFWAVWGNPQISSYAIANSYIDALAQHRLALGLSATATAWGVWDGLGLGNVEQRLDRIGFRRIAPATAMAAFEQIFARGERAMMVADMDWARFAGFYAAQRHRRLLEAIPEARAVDGSLGEPGRIAELRAAPVGQRPQLLLELVAERTASVLGLPAARLDPDRGFTDLGLDSIMAVELRTSLERATGLTLPATFVFEHPCVRDAAVSVGEQLGLVGEARASVSVTPAPASMEPVAIVGIGLRVPGGATDLDALYRLLEREFDAVGPVPIERWDAEAFYDRDPDAHGKTYVREAAFVSGVELFDPGFFNISPREAERIDPQHRLLLEASWEALERADVVPASLRASATGVFVGIGQSDYEFMQQRSGLLDPYTTLGTHGSFAAGRIAFCLGLQGPAMSVDTACSSSLVALHLACQSLRTGECNLALVGGVQVMAGPDYGIQLARTRSLARDGRCKTFSAAADGFGRGEGVVVLAVERLSDARRNGRRILAVVRGSGVNHDGASSGITAPNGTAQQKVIRTALADAGLGPLDVAVVECHGTGTELGDPIEVRALDAVYGDGRPADEPLLIGSIKTNVGHLESGAGLAGVAKLLTAFVHEAIPATIHTRPRNQHLDWERLRISVVDALRPWPRRVGEVRRAGVSSFGLSGTNAHAILEEAPTLDERRVAGEEPVIAPLLLSGRSEQAVREQVRRLRVWLDERPQLRRQDVAYSLATARTHFEQRICVVGDLDSELEIHAAVRAPRLALMFAGQGSQRPGMGAALYAALPSFREAFDATCSRFDQALEVPLREVVFAEAGSRAAALLDSTEYTQPALFAFELALARALEGFGVRPQIVLGHSLGEFVAGHVAGVFDLDDVCRLVAARARLMGSLLPGGAMISIEASEQEVAAMLGDGIEVDIAGLAGRMSTVISGDEDAALAIAASFAARGRRTKRLTVSHAFHSRRMNPMLDEFATVARTVRYRTPQIPMVSCVTGAEVEAGVLERAEYWVEQVSRPVRFGDGVVSLANWGATALVEIGPRAVLGSMAAASLEAESVRGVEPTIVTSLRGDRPELECLTELLGRLHGHGVEVDWEAVFAGCDVRRVELPTYAFARERCWLPVAVTRAPSSPVAREEHPFLGRALRVSADAVLFERSLSITELRWLGDHRIGGACLFPGAGVVELALAAGREVAGVDACVVEQLRLDRALLLRDDRPTRIQVALREADFSVSELVGETWQQRSSARVVRSLPETTAPNGSTLDELRERCSERRSAAEFYASTDRLGYAYGPAFRGIEDLWLSRDGATALGRIALPRVTGSDAQFIVHPALLDACFQLTLATGPVAAGPMVPVQIDRIALMRPIGERSLWCSATTRAHGGAGRTITQLRLFDERGAVIGWVDGFIAEPLERESVIEDDDALVHAVLEPVWRELGQLSGTAALPGRWMIFAGVSERRLGERVRTTFQARGAQAEMIVDVEPDDRGAIDRRLDAALREPLAGVVSLWALGDPMPASVASPIEIGRRGWAGALHLTQSLVGRRLRRPPRLVLVTQRVQDPSGEGPTRPEQSPCWGLGASIRSEHAELRPLRIDLGEPGDDVELAALVELALSDTREDQVTVRGATRHVARLVHARVARVDEGPIDRPARRLVIDRAGSLDDLRLDRVSRLEPGPGEVEIAVEAAAVNFRDVLLATAVVPPIGDDRVRLGFECAGTITEVGPDTDGSLAVGDRVLALTVDGFATHVLARAQLVLPMPAGLSWTEAATLPQVQISAYYALHHVARLRKGERVLIHSATGGVGLAALQWAQHVGAEIYATAGSEQKREWLRAQGIEYVSDSRSTSFADDVRRWTRGEGVDVVLNSLSGELMRRSLSLVRPGGRFVELGLRDAIAHAQLDLAPFVRGIGYTLVNLGELILHAPDRVRELFEEVLEHVRTGVLAPLPQREAPLSSAPQLLWEMGRGRHIGKFVVRVGEPERAELARKGRALVSADASYLITGGLGGLGLALARSLAEQGAGELILIGRGGVCRDDQRAALRELEALGTRVRVEAIDVADREPLARLVAGLPAERPLRGIVHAAAVLEDAMLVNQTLEGFERVLSPKVAGAWNLHAVSEGLELDFFVLYGSVASALGAPGQANYVAGNAFLAALARHRRGQGLPALCLGWGPFADVGLAASDAARGVRLGSRGLHEFASDEGLELFSRLRASDSAELLPCRFDVGTWAEFYPEAASWPYLSELRSAGSTSKGARAFREDLVGRPAIVVRKLLVDLVVRELVRVTRVDPAKVDPATPFAELGVDSLLGIELRNRLRAATRVELSSTAIWTHPSPAELAAELFELIGKDEPEPEPATAPPPALDVELQATLELDIDTATNELLAELEDLDRQAQPEVRSHV